MSRGTPMRTCARCAGFFLTWDYVNADDPYFCPKCLPKCVTDTHAEFDPQPHDHVRDVDNMSGPLSDLIVVARDGDTVTVQPLGCPGRRRDVHVGQLARGVGR